MYYNPLIKDEDYYKYKLWDYYYHYYKDYYNSLIKDKDAQIGKALSHSGITVNTFESLKNHQWKLEFVSIILIRKMILK